MRRFHHRLTGWIRLAADFDFGTCLLALVAVTAAAGGSGGGLVGAALVGAERNASESQDVVPALTVAVLVALAELGLGSHLPGQHEQEHAQGGNGGHSQLPGLHLS